MASGSGDEGRSLTFKVDRGADADHPNVDYLRLGDASDDAVHSGKTSVEDHGVGKMVRDGGFDRDLNHLGGGGRFVYSDGHSTTYIAGDSFERVSGDAYRSHGTSHDIVKDTGSKNVYKIVGTRPLTPLDLGYGTHYELKRGTAYYFKSDMSLAYEAAVKYDCKLVGSISSELALKFALSSGPSAASTGAKFSMFGYEATVDGTGAFKSNRSLGVGKVVRTLADEMILLGLTDTISQSIWKGIWLTLLGLAQATNLAYIALNAGVTVQFDDFEKDPDELAPWLTGLQIVALAQSAIGLVFAAAAAIEEAYYNAHADGVQNQLFNPITGKPYIRILPTGNGTIELATGQGASIKLSGDEVYIHGSAIQIKAGGGQEMIQDGVRVSSHSGPLDCYSSHRDGAAFGSNMGRANLYGQDININANFGSSVTSTGATWTHNGEFKAGNTTVGDLTVGRIHSSRKPLMEGAPASPPTGWVAGEMPMLPRLSIISSVSGVSVESLYATL